MSNFSKRQEKTEAFNQKIALCTIGRMENQYIREYVLHYKALGFNKIFLYDNNYDGEEHFELVIGDLIQQGFVELIDYRNKPIAQVQAYNDCYQKHGDEFDWMAFFDADEFLIVKKTDIHSLLYSARKEFDCMLFNWMVMTDNGQVYNTQRPLMERFTTPMDLDKCIGYKDIPEDNHVKCIVKGGLKNVKFGNPHVPLTPIRCCNAKLEVMQQSPLLPYDHSVAYLKHYQYKTIEEWLTNKRRRGTPDRSYEQFIQDTPIENFFKVNEKTQDKLDYINKQRKQLVIVSMTTIPKRMKRLEDNLPAILHQTFRYDKLIINVDDNLTEEEYQWYENLKQYDQRIEINKAEAKWRSCNKLLPTLKKYPHDVIITCDDDIFYEKDSFLRLVQEYMKHPQCIIALEANPITIDKNGFINYVNGYDVMLQQVCWSKYLSNCCLFPPYSFDEDLFDYDKMLECTKGLHDELWAWVCSTLHGVQSISLNYVRSLADDMLDGYKEDEYCLSHYNNTNENILDYMQRIDKMYGKKLLDNIQSKPVVFTITNENIYSFYFLLPYIKQLYGNSVIQFDNNLTASWRNHLLAVLNGKQPTI